MWKEKDAIKPLIDIKCTLLSASYSIVSHQRRNAQLKQQMEINKVVELFFFKKARKIKKKSSLYHYLYQQITNTTERRKSA